MGIFVQNRKNAAKNLKNVIPKRFYIKFERAKSMMTSNHAALVLFILNKNEKQKIMKWQMKNGEKSRENERKGVREG